MLRLCWLITVVVLFALAGLCYLSDAQAQRGGKAPPCAYSVNWTYQVQWVPVPVTPSPTQSTMRSPPPNKSTPPHHNTAVTTPPPPPAHPVTTYHETPVTHTTTVKKEKPVEHTYVTHQETVHHNLTVHVQRTPEVHTVVEKHTTTKGVTHVPTAPPHGEPGHVPSKPPETTHSHVVTEQRHYEYHNPLKVHVTLKEPVEVTHTVHHTVEHVTTEESHTQTHKLVHAETHLEPKPVSHPTTPAHPEPPKAPPKEPVADKPPPDSKTGVRWVPVVKWTAHVDFSCGQCHHQSLPPTPLMATNKPQCGRPTMPLLADVPLLTQKVPARPTPTVFEWPTKASPVVPMIARGPQAPLPSLFASGPVRVPQTSGNKKPASMALIWEVAAPMPASFSTTSPATGPQSLPLVVSDSAELSEPSFLTGERPVALDLIFQAPALPPVFALPPGQEEGEVPPPSVAQVALTPPALPPIDWPLILSR